MWAALLRTADEVGKWQTRDLEALYPVIYLDAIIVKIRDGGHHQRGFGWVSVSSYGTCHDLRCHHVDPTVWHGLDAALKEHPTTGLHPANR
ncbi:hypothetical protein GCM10009855_21170 [Gordonia cholesterolivorans]|uniref:Mutator family transposase n=1 Tax=Gordonia cholesterolivorans TaxID=559625 RepID=A0ABP5UI21_9ACTN